MVQYYPTICTPSCCERFGSTRSRLQETPDSTRIFPTTFQSLHAGAATLWMHGRGKNAISNKNGQKRSSEKLFRQGISKQREKFLLAHSIILDRVGSYQKNAVLTLFTISLQQVIEIDPSQKGRIRVAMTVTTEPNLEVVKQKESQHVERYMTGTVDQQ